MDDFKRKAATKEWSCYATPPYPAPRNKVLRARLKAELRKDVLKSDDDPWNECDSWCPYCRGDHDPEEQD